VRRAREIGARLEANNINQNTIGQNILSEGKRGSEQVNLFEWGKTELIDEIRGIDVNAMTPVEALNELYLLKEKARKL